MDVKGHNCMFICGRLEFVSFRAPAAAPISVGLCRNRDRRDANAAFQEYGPAIGGS